jgi:glycosyltransferase involved in cell wall biosynthesis
MDILCFGSADFEEPSWVNAQHLMYRLAREHRILYVNSLGLRQPRVRPGDARKIARRISGLWQGVRRPFADRDLHVVSPLNAPPLRSRLLRNGAAAVVASRLRRAVRQAGLRRPLAWVFLPSAAPLLDRFDLRAVIYHCVDAYEANPGVDAALVRGLERDLLARANWVIASSRPLFDRLRAQHSQVLLMPNVADIASLPPPGSAPPVPPDLARIPRPRIGYVGNLAAYKCDLGLLASAAARCDHSWVFVGGVGRGEGATDLAHLTELPHVHLLGEKPYAELGAYLHHLDVGLIPFAANDTTRHSFPMKFFEYLACGRPVVSAPLESLRDFLRPPFAFTYTGEDEFLKAIDAALATGDEQAARQRRALAEEHSWERRMEEVAALLSSL